MSRNMKLARVFQGLLNDLKRRPEDAARELGISETRIQSILDGTEELDWPLIRRAAEIWPVNERDFFPIWDDCPSGAAFMSADESKRSARIMERAGSPYYEYRDTAMSRVACFRPEWIKELCVVENSQPENTRIQWNNGHFMHQFTYFVGPVNFYYVDNHGEKRVAEMNTGDSMYISPYVPHTFATRENPDGIEGLILALTFGDKVVGDSLYQLEALGLELGKEFFLEMGSRAKGFGSLLRFFRDSMSMSIKVLSSAAEISEERLQKLENGEFPTIAELERLAQGLAVNTRDLMPPDVDIERVVIQTFASSKVWNFPDDTPRYQFRELAHTKVLPSTKALLLTVNDSESEDVYLKFGLHQYLYNIGVTPVSIYWMNQGERNQRVLAPGDSVFIKPFLKHGFSGGGELLSLRSGGHLAGEAMRELSSIGKAYATRVIDDSQQWFNPGRSSQ